MTRLSGLFEIKLDFDMSPAATNEEMRSLPTLPEALAEQLGLRVEVRNLPTDIVVVDHVEKTPVDNYRCTRQGDQIMKIIACALTFCAVLLGQPGRVNYLGPSEGRVVGKPYSATRVTHTSQTLVNGSHIDRTITSLMWQDDQGRLRMESTDDHRRIMIADFVAGVTYNIDAEDRTVRKIDMGSAAAAKAQKIAGDVSPFEEAQVMARRNPGTQVEDLGSKFMNGVSALGVRLTTTIPVGAIGNDNEIQSVIERWYSNDIHAMVKTVTTDPRNGTLTYELTHIVRVNPDPALFQVPPGFTITVQGPALPLGGGEAVRRTVFLSSGDHGCLGNLPRPALPPGETENGALTYSSQEVRRHDVDEFTGRNHLRLLPELRKMAGITSHQVIGARGIGAFHEDIIVGVGRDL
jgi:Protein of unknown function (DUF3738)